jgi:hypothetical protein
MDEKGLMLGILTRSKRVFSSRLYEAGKLNAHIQDGNREWITLLACICADGSHIEPSLIYQSASSSCVTVERVTAQLYYTNLKTLPCLPYVQ